ncbi:ribosomal RNA processing protein 1 homolog isoform X2 [Athalia rosae]|uniref:ribosomal RNA processing protein 1 homolog isoform X2 n=1 Tax=Athalia rosae TaxID=37344 RepID=UPI002033477C|nr:ribosomal RNA processing protein 1 homolog isoform X2 [Athalia rosae]
MSPPDVRNYFSRKPTNSLSETIAFDLLVLPRSWFAVLSPWQWVVCTTILKTSGSKMSVKKLRKKHTHVSPRIKRIGFTQKNETFSKSEVKKVAKNSKASVIAHEIKYVKLLADNDKKVRDKVLKNLRKWLIVRSRSAFAFVEQDFMRLWKGLYYCMWMSDKPLTQEDLAEAISKFVHCFNNSETTLLYIKCTLWTLATEWFGIDQHRLDKFQMLIRRIIRQTFEICKKNSWSHEWVDGIAKIIESVLIESKTTIGFNLHLTELYLEELSKVSGGDIPEDIVLELVRPFAIQLATIDDGRQTRHVMKHIFRHLIFQSNIGMDYIEQFEAWKHAGFPGGNIDAMQKVETENAVDESGKESIEDADDNDKFAETGEEPLDPRAGKVDVVLPQLPFNAKAMAELIILYRFHPSSTSKTRKQILQVAKEFTELSAGRMPLGIKKIELYKGSKGDLNSRSAALRLLHFEQELYSDTTRGKRKKKSSHTMEKVVDSDIDSLHTKKKSKPEAATNKKKRKVDTSDTIEDISKSENSRMNPNKVKSKALDQPKNKKRIRTLIGEDSLPVVKRSNEKKKKIAETEQSAETKTSLVENIVHKIMKSQNKIEKLKQTNIKNISADNDLIISVQYSKPEAGVKNLNKYSTDGNWSVSENVNATPRLPKNLKAAAVGGNVQDDPNAIKQSQQDDASSWLTPIRAKKIPKNMKIITKMTSPATPQAQIIKETASSSSKKKVKIVLQNNTSQYTSEYMRQLRQSPAIPFDASRKPLVGVLKPSPIPSPVNPFYRR